MCCFCWTRAKPQRWPRGTQPRGLQPRWTTPAPQVSFRQLAATCDSWLQRLWRPLGLMPASSSRRSRRHMHPTCLPCHRRPAWWRLRPATGTRTRTRTARIQSWVGAPDSGGGGAGGGRLARLLRTCTPALLDLQIPPLPPPPTPSQGRASRTVSRCGCPADSPMRRLHPPCCKARNRRQSLRHGRCSPVRPLASARWQDCAAPLLAVSGAQPRARCCARGQQPPVVMRAKRWALGSAITLRAVPWQRTSRTCGASLLSLPMPRTSTSDPP
jgi:hypothetical protein